MILTLEEIKIKNLLLDRLNFYDIQSEEYRITQKTFRWFINKIRIKEKTDQENIH